MNGQMNLQPGQGGLMDQDPEQQRRLQEYWASVAAMGPQKKAFMRQRGIAEQLRAGGPQARMRVSGGGKTGRPEIVQAAHPLEHLADLARVGGAAYLGSKADTSEDAYAAARRKAMADLMSQQQQGGGYGGAGGTGYGSQY
jgi:hypothetical protein